ncbi:hypothetical protein CIB87_28140 [Priestia megaterium]|uniref:Phage tail protein n=1 Tax=Priestia megaterium TaxID=1404 RepID=A0AA86IF38_PRIMG|nr:distal tail protein Dit [Priestia megaterium]AXI32661.1 hypothetical protein CIB87_28140 [Priestia megaterium]
MGMIFNNQRRNYLTVLKGRKRPAWASITRDIIVVPNSPGGYLKKTQTNIREITVPILIESTSIANLQKLKEDLGSWLVTKEACPLIFDDEPDRIYYAVIDNTIDLEEIVELGTGELNFICPKPFKYSNVSKYQNSIVSDGVSLLTLTNKGTVEAQPTFEVQIDGDYTHIDISNGDVVNRIGRIVDLEKYSAKQPKELILSDSLSTTVGWGKVEGNSSIDGSATGNMKSNGYTFQAADYGTITSEWHGPFYKKSLGQVLTDFQLEATLEFTNPYSNQLGKVEVYLLDDANEIVGKVAMKNTFSSDNKNIAEVRAGGANITDLNNYFISDRDYDAGYRDFYGILRIGRVGNEWNAYVARVNPTTGKHFEVISHNFTDTTYGLTKKPSQIGIFIAQFGSRPSALLAAHKVQVYKINQLTESQIPYIVSKGDVVKFDHEKKDILINGESRMDLKAFGGEFFELDPGDNVVVGSPPLPIKATWRERYR